MERVSKARKAKEKKGSKTANVPEDGFSSFAACPANACLVCSSSCVCCSCALPHFSSSSIAHWLAWVCSSAACAAICCCNCCCKTAICCCNCCCKTRNWSSFWCSSSFSDGGEEM